MQWKWTLYTLNVSLIQRVVLLSDWSDYTEWQLLLNNHLNKTKNAMISQKPQHVQKKKQNSFQTLVTGLFNN